jgi:uncharacterized protein YrzB (UPF0473 family)
MDNENKKENYGPDIITVIDEDGKEHTFDELDRIETDDGKYVAMTPSFDGTEDIIDSDGELIILKVREDEGGETWLEPIEDENEFAEVSAAFEQRLSEYYDIEEDDDEDNDPSSIIGS